MNVKKLFRNLYILFGATLVLVSLFVSCSASSSGGSFISQLDEIDAYISVGNTSDAFANLKSLEKKAHTSLEILSIYKRYLVIGENERSEKFIQKGLKSHSGNIELTAAYTHFLLNQDRLQDALETGKILLDTKYSSLYAEAVLRNARENELTAELVFNPPKKKKNIQKTPEDIEMCFHDSRFIPYFIDAYGATGNTLWIINSAVLYMQQGDYARAAQLLVDTNAVKDVQDSYFWGCVLFDASRFTESLDVLLEHQEKWDTSGDSLRAMALASDCLYILGEDLASSDLRERMLSIYREAENIEQYRDIIPIVYLDSAIYARQQDDMASEYILVKDLVDYYPMYEPGLAFYGEFALETLRRPPEEELLQRIRKSGLRTQSMEKYDLIPTVALEDAMNRIEYALLQEKKPELVVLKEKMYQETHMELSGGEKLGRAWKMLEDNEIGTNMYPSAIMRFAISTMVAHSASDEAFDLFNRYLEAVHGIEFKDLFEADRNINLSLWEYEMAAWFYKDVDVKKSQQLYQLILDSYGTRLPSSITNGQNSSVVGALVNLSVIEGGYSHNQESYDLLNAASAKAVDSRTKAEILFRMAELEVGEGNNRDAIRSLKYVISLNPSHNKARLLLKTLNGSK